MKKKYQALIAEAQKLMDQHKEGMPKNVADQVNGILSQADELKVQIDLAERVADGQKYMDEPGEKKVTHHGWRQSGRTEGEGTVDPQAWRSIKVYTPFGDKEIRFHVPLEVQKSGYASAFEAYVRKGYFDSLGPSDRKALTEGVDSSGGFLVPEDLQTELIRKQAAKAVIRGIARVMQTSRDVFTKARQTYTTDDTWSGPARLTWTGEQPASGSVHRVSDRTIGLTKIPVNTAMASQLISNDVIEDSAYDVIGEATTDLSEAFALGEDDVFINGTGANQPKGILTDIGTAGKGPIATNSGGASTLTGDGLLDLWGSLASQYHGPNTRWVMAMATMLAVKKLKDGQNRYLLDAMSTGNLQSPVVQVLVDRPVLYDEFVPAVAANAYPIIFGDFSGYYVIDRVGLSIQVLRERYAEENQTLLLAKKRVGGGLVEDYKLKVQKVAS